MWSLSESQVGAVPYTDQAVSAADVYSYGAASAAYSQGQAMAAWAELSAQQNTPAIKSVAYEHSCPDGFLIAPDLKTCVNQAGVHVALVPVASACKGDNWYWCSLLPAFLSLNETEALNSGSLNSVADAALRGMRALRMTTGSYGWSSVKSQLRAVATLLSRNTDEWATDSVDSLQWELEKRIGPYYDSDVASAKASGDSGGIVPGLGGSGIYKKAGELNWGKYLVLLGAVGFGLSLYRPRIAIAAYRALASLPTRALGTVRRVAT
jgi:hypothetical protein